MKIVVSVTAPKEMRGFGKHFRREPNTFYIGHIVNDKTVWKEVR